MLTSKEVMARTGISRATLNNYIALGILPRPTVGPPTPDDPQARRIGYFDDDAVDRIEQVQELKSSGLKMSEIARRFAGADIGDLSAAGPAPELGAAPEAELAPRNLPARLSGPGGPLHLSIDRLPYPAYMVTSNFQVQWWNDEAADRLFGTPGGLEDEIEARNIFQLLMRSGRFADTGARREVMSFHMSIAKKRMRREAFAQLSPDLDDAQARLITSLYDDVPVAAPHPILRHAISLHDGDGEQAHDIFASFFREGILFTYVPADAAETILDFLARRERVIRELLRNRQPYLTGLSVLAAALSNEQRLKGELPPQEYFALSNEIWRRMDPVFRKYYGTHGKHQSDGLLYYFFPQPDSNFAMNAACCALELRDEVARISRDWRGRLSWLPELELRIGLDEGREWFGSLNSAAHFEFVVLGETAHRAHQLSTLGKRPAIWSSKNLVSELDNRDRLRLNHGITRRDSQGNSFFISETFAEVRNLFDLEDQKNSEIAGLADFTVCELDSVRQSEIDESTRTGTSGGNG